MENRSLTPYQFTIDAAVAEWIAQKSTRTGSQKTREAYTETMRQFRAALAQVNLDLLDNPIDIARVAAIWANLRAGSSRQVGQDVTPSTYNQRLAILSSWYSFVQDTYHLAIPNPIKYVKKRPVQAYAAAEPIVPETVEESLDAIDRTTPEGLRNYALLAIALATGRRAPELAGLRGADVRITGGRKNTRIRLTFYCKGGKLTCDLLDPETSAGLLDHLDTQFGKQLTNIPPEGPVWVSYSRQNRGQAISTKTLSNICAAYMDTSKVMRCAIRSPSA